MNTREKRKYITDLLTFNTPPFLCEFETRHAFLNYTPLTLFKYRPFDKYSFEMISEGYSFLAPVQGLDDPFDCMNSSKIKDFYDPKKGGLTDAGLNYIVGLITKHGLPPQLTKSELLQLAKSSMNGDQIDYELASRRPLVQDSLSQTEVETFLGTMRTFNENLPGILENDAWESFAKNALSPGQRVGICSLSETRDNKPMWSLYGAGYSGYCIEYEIPRCKELILNLCPVIYTKRANNNLIKKMLEYALSAMMRAFSNGRISGNIGAAMELFCTKDSDWSYQKEWRIIGKAGERCTAMPIKAIYLGFKASKRNIARMKRVAKKKRFSLFLMNPPDGTKRISYKQLV